MTAVPERVPAPVRTGRSGTATRWYIGSVVVLGFALTAGAARVHGFSVDPGVGVFALLAVLAYVAGDVVVEGRVRISYASIVVVAAAALYGAAAGGVVGALMGAIPGRQLPPRARVFNAGQSCVQGVLAGLAFKAAGGMTDNIDGTTEAIRLIAVPVLVADIVQALTNLLLLAIVVRISEGTPMRVQIGTLLVTTLPADIAYGAIAFLMIVLWRPAGMGPAAAVIVLAPLLVALWAYRQHADELQGQQRALQVLVAAVETKVPHLTGHSDRVADLSGFMAESLGLGPKQVADVRVAGMLHDLGQTGLPTRLVRARDAATSEEFMTYPTRGANLLREIRFLAGALPAIESHHTALRQDRDGTLPARIVGLADAYDLLTEVGSPDGTVLSRAEAVATLRARPQVAPELARCLEAALHVVDENDARRAAGGGR